MVQNTVNAVFSRFRFPNSEDVDAHETGKYPRGSEGREPRRENLLTVRGRERESGLFSPLGNLDLLSLARPSMQSFRSRSFLSSDATNMSGDDRGP